MRDRIEHGVINDLPLIAVSDKDKGVNLIQSHRAGQAQMESKQLSKP